MFNETTKLSQKPRSRAERKVRREFDIPALRWIGQQYAIRLDQLQRLFGQLTDHCNPKPIGEGATRDVVTRWKNAGWVETEQIQAQEWIWPTRLGLSRVGLRYSEQDIRQCSPERLSHLAALNEIRLGEDYSDDEWISERQLLWEVDGQDWLGRPDAVIYWSNNEEVIAIKVELSLKDPQELTETITELLVGVEYYKMYYIYGMYRGKEMDHDKNGPFTWIWYFGPKPVRKQVRQVCADLLKQGALSTDDADRLIVYWYPLPKTEQEEDREEQEEHETPDLEESDLEEIRPSAEGRTGE